MSDFWTKVTDLPSLRAAWHLTRAEIRSDFFYDFLHQQSFANALEPQLKELQRVVREDGYAPRPLRAVPVPKGPLSTRPGSLTPLRDRVLMWSVVRTIARHVYLDLKDSVYSYRLKENPKKGELFKEGDALSLPFVKGKEISAQLDPFEPWYGLWPDFEERTKEVIGSGYRFMVVSDIAAYFENINLEILAQQIATKSGDAKVSNLVSNTLHFWVTRSKTGHRPQRGIPQGSGSSSFFGNIYLMPIDDHFQNFMKTHDSVYIRYMDDIRIFCKTRNNARKAAFELEECARQLHLNLQNSKTKILEETEKEKNITNFLFDDRVDSLLALKEQIDKGKISADEASPRLARISKREPVNPESKRIYLSYPTLNNLSDRANRLWMNTSLAIKDGNYIDTLIRHINYNPDQKYSRIFINTCKRFPRHSRLGNSVRDFLLCDRNIHNHQEAELLRASRYLSTIPDELWKRALNHILGNDRSFMITIQSLLLLGMRSHNTYIRERIWEACLHDTDIISHPYYIAIAGQFTGYYRIDVIEYYRKHANPHNQEFGVLMRDLDTNYRILDDWLKYVFSQDDLLIDWQGMLWFVANSEWQDRRQQLKEKIKARLKRGNLRKVLKLRLTAMANMIG